MPGRPVRPLLSPRAGVSERTTFVPERFQAALALPALSGALLIAAVLFFALMPTRGYELPVTLAPVALEAAEAELPPGQVVLHVSGEETLLNGAPIELRSLEAPLRAALAGQPDPVVVFDAKDDLPYGEVVRMLDAIHTAGGRTVALAPSISAFLQVETTNDSSRATPSPPLARPVSNAQQLEEAP